MSFVDPYIDPASGVLQNKFGIANQRQLDRIEREWVVQRILEGCPEGGFDLAHLQSIHRHLFQDIYDWAGKLRTVELSKNGDQFQPVSYVRTGMQDIYSRLISLNFLKGVDERTFANEVARIIGDINYVHPFREGNGRAQLQYLQQLALQASHLLDLSIFEQTGWIDASRASHRGDYSLMASQILRAIESAK